MEEKQKPLRTAASKVKDIYNAYRKNDEKADVVAGDEVVHATTSQDINQVHVPHENVSESTEQGSGQQNTDLEEIVIQNEALRDNVLRLEKERDDMRDQVLRKVAEFENFRKRTEREKEQLALYVSEKLFSRLVDVLDDLHAALEAGRKSDDYASMLSGLELIYNKTHRIYEEHGVKPLNAEQNMPFNVDVHEALMHIPHPDVSEGMVVQQIQRGYMLNDKVLRHAKVVTSAGNGDN